MQRNKSLIMLGLAIIIALAATWYTYSWLKARSRISSSQRQQLVAAARDLPAGTVLGKENIRLVTITGSRPAGSFSDPLALEGRTLSQSVKTSEPVSEASLAPAVVKTGGMAAMLDPKRRAVAVKVDKVAGVAGFIRPGNHVDVLVTLRPTEKATSSITKTVLEDVPVLAAGTEMQNLGKKEKAVEVDVITLEVSPDDAEKLALASNEGRLQLALRSPADSSTTLTQGATIPALLASCKAPVAVARKAKTKTGRKDVRVAKAVEIQPPPPIPTVPVFSIQVIKGTNVSERKF